MAEHLSSPLYNHGQLMLSAISPPPLSSSREEVRVLEKANERLMTDLRAAQESEKQAKDDLAGANAELERYASKSRREELLQTERLNEQINAAQKDVKTLRAQLEQARQEAEESKKLNVVIEKLRKELATRPVPRVLSNEEIKEVRSARSVHCVVLFCFVLSCLVVSCRVWSCRALLLRSDFVLCDLSRPAVHARPTHNRRVPSKQLIAKLQQTESAAESAFTCLVCMEMFQNPVTCIPCGHSFCKKCIEGKVQAEGRSHCPACSGTQETDEKKGGSVDYFIENQLLQNLAAKHEFRKTLLGSLDVVALS